MTTQPAGEHHTGTLNLAGQGNPPQVPARDVVAALLWVEIWDDNTPYSAASPAARSECEAAADRILEAAYPAIRQQVAEQIAGKGNEIAEEYQATAITHRDLSIEHGRTLKGTSHMTTAHAYRNKAEGAWAVAHAAREIGGQA